MLTTKLSISRRFAACLLAGVLAATPMPGVAQQSLQPPAVQSDMPALAPLTATTDTAPVIKAAPDASPAPALSQNAGQNPAAPQPAAPLSDTAAPAVSETAQLQTDYSAFGMYRAAHWVVKLVMLSLIFASFVTWTVLVFKMIELVVARRRAKGAVRTIHDADTLETASAQLSMRRDPAAFMAQAALIEYRRSDPAIPAAGPDGVKERTRSVLDRIEVQASSRIRKGTGLLATIGATAPFVGLFGTVWGIMNAFIGIAETKTTNLAVVAPGIAEALLATAIGLIVAIPAVVIYNHFSREIAAYRQSLGDAAAGVERLLSRDLDFRHVTAGV